MLLEQLKSAEPEITLSCAAHEKPLRSAGESLRCPMGCQFPIVGDIPRFVPKQDYAASFGLQWNQFRRTQLDSFTGHPVSEDRLTRLLGGSMEVVRGKLVLEAGCGAGRFTELLLQAGARVVAVDLSTAVEANRENCGHFPGYAVAQGDIRQLPIASEQFDVVLCVGVVQHTPDPEETMASLCRHVRPGGLLVIDHYTQGAHRRRLVPKLMRAVLTRSAPGRAMRLCELLMDTLWPVHRAAWRVRNLPGGRLLRKMLLRLSPLVDYHDAYSFLGDRLMHDWALLDMHDSNTDRFKHLRSAAQIREQLIRSGMCEIETVYAGNGVEARARKPL